MNLPEASICAAAVEHLRSDGWRVVCEVPFHGRAIDAAATKMGKLILIEAKTSFTRSLKQQVQGLSFYADFALSVVGTKPRADTLAWCKDESIGVWMIRAGAVVELVAMRTNAKAFARDQSMIHRVLTMNEATAGGVPNLKGIGPAQEVQAEIDAYRAEHPKATWKELFEKVPNHYVSASSMASAMRNNYERLAYRARMRLLGKTEKEAE